MTKDPEWFQIHGQKARTLCYGENKRQGNACLYIEMANPDHLALDQFELIEGNDPSYVNMTDVHRLIETATRIGAGWESNFGFVPELAIAVKHGNACGVAVGKSPHQIVRQMIAGDADAISGGIVLLNFHVDFEIAQILRSHLMPEGPHRRILDSIIAPSFSEAAVDELARKSGRCRVFRNQALAKKGLGIASIDITPRFRQVRGGFLVQDGDPFILTLEPKWAKSLTSEQMEDVLLSWAIGSTSNSNTITLVRDGMLIGQGVGQQSRVMSAKLAILRASTCGHFTIDAVAYSDSFFPFPDGPKVLAEAGISTIFATSGSIRDNEVIEACANWGVTLLLLPDAVARGFYGH